MVVQKVRVPLCGWVTSESFGKALHVRASDGGQVYAPYDARGLFFYYVKGGSGVKTIVTNGMFTTKGTTNMDYMFFCFRDGRDELSDYQLQEWLDMTDVTSCKGMFENSR